MTAYKQTLASKVKEKKKTIRHYLNKNLKPNHLSNGTPTYPVYVKVIYDRDTLQFKSRMVKEYQTEQHYNMLVKTNQNILESEIQLVTQLVEGLIERDRFSRELFYEQYHLLTTTFYEFMNDITRFQVNDEFQHALLVTSMLAFSEKMKKEKNLYIISYMLQWTDQDIVHAFESFLGNYFLPKTVNALIKTLIFTIQRFEKERNTEK